MTTVIVTDLTRMSGTRICLAGYELADGEVRRCIRPELHYENLTEDWLYSREGVVRPFSVIDLRLFRAQPEPPHTGDWIVDRKYALVDPYADSRARDLLELTASPSLAEVYGAELEHDQQWFVRAGSGRRSLGTVTVSEVLGMTFRERPEFGKWDYRIRFRDESGAGYNLSVTDLAFRYLLDHLRDVEGLAPDAAAARVARALNAAEALFLTVGLARPFPPERSRCFVQVTGVYSFPDYLDGRCHADLRPAPKVERLPDVPF